MHTSICRLHIQFLKMMLEGEINLFYAFSIDSRTAGSTSFHKEMTSAWNPRDITCDMILKRVMCQVRRRQTKYKGKESALTDHQ